MSKPTKCVRLSALLLPILLGAGGAQAASSQCEEAWAAYNEFKARNVMEESQYTLTVYGTAVRSACGKEALPAPPGADVVPVRPRVKKPKPPQKPPPPWGTPETPDKPEKHEKAEKPKTN